MRPTNPYPLWAARFWHGILPGAWLRILARNRFRVHPIGMPLVATVGFATLINQSGRWLRRLILGRKLARMQVRTRRFYRRPLRSGTTLLHELLVLDRRYTYPTTYDCFAPDHFLVSAWCVKKLKFLLPSQRPMDNMITGWERPQEDEFALCNLGVPSPYLTMLFPNEPEQYPEYFDLEQVSAEDRRKWQDALYWFLQRVTYRNPQRIILKSPPHLGRIKALLEIFPDARFVHIVRDPYVVYASTIKLWHTLYTYQSLQLPKFEHLEEYVFRCFERMYTAFEAQRNLVDPSRLYEIRYEDLVATRSARCKSCTTTSTRRVRRGAAAAGGVRRRDQGLQDQQIPDRSGRAAEDRRPLGPVHAPYGYCQPTSVARSAHALAARAPGGNGTTVPLQVATPRPFYPPFDSPEWGRAEVLQATAVWASEWRTDYCA